MDRDYSLRVLRTMLIVFVALVLGSTLLVFSCALTSVNRAEKTRLQVSSYHSTETGTIFAELGQAIEDDGMFSLADDEAVLIITGLVNGNYTIHFGSVRDTYGVSYQETATDGTITILKSELIRNSFSFIDGAVIGISGQNFIDLHRMAMYSPSNIYNHQDLQAMRNDLARDYVLKKDIVFPSPAGAGTNTSTSNYEAVGNEDAPFTGSLSGAGNSIAGVQIVSTDNYQGLFGVMEAGSADAVLAQNLVLSDFKITGNAAVGSLAGWVKQGTVEGVSLVARAADAGKAEVRGSVNVGGLVGFNDGGTVTGYATGDVIGDDSVGGLVGFNNGGTVTGYARGIVRRVSGTEVSFGKTIGLDTGTKTTYSSASSTESQIYDGATGTTALAGTTGVDGTAVDVASAMQTTFADLTFGTELGEWIWVEDGKWPVINHR